MKIYENIVIGNFLYTLGWSIGKERKYVPSVINLLQQTPEDKLMGDVLLEYPGVVRLIEFKNKKSSIKKEKRKLGMIEKSLSDNKRMIELSRSVHWYIETDPLNEDCICRIVQYLDAFKNIPKLTKKNLEFVLSRLDNIDQESEYITSDFTLESFVNEMVNEVITPKSRFEPEEYKKYFELISASQGTKRGGGGESTSGLAIVFSEEGGFRYAQYANIHDFGLQHSQYINMVKEHMTSVMKSERQYMQEQTQHNSRGQGMNR